MKKIMIVAAMLAMMLAVTVPAFAQITNSGDVVSGTGNVVDQSEDNDVTITTTQFTVAECINIASATTGDQFAVNTNIVSGTDQIAANEQSAVNVGSAAVAVQDCRNFITIVY